MSEIIALATIILPVVAQIILAILSARTSTQDKVIEANQNAAGVAVQRIYDVKASQANQQASMAGPADARVQQFYTD